MIRDECYYFAELFHDTYERIAREKGWKSQFNCRVLFDKLPKENRETMIATIEEILPRIKLFLSGGYVEGREIPFEGKSQHDFAEGGSVLSNKSEKENQSATSTDGRGSSTPQTENQKRLARWRPK